MSEKHNQIYALEAQLKAIEQKLSYVLESTFLGKEQTLSPDALKGLEEILFETRDQLRIAIARVGAEADVDSWHVQ